MQQTKDSLENLLNTVGRSWKLFLPQRHWTSLNVIEEGLKFTSLRFDVADNMLTIVLPLLSTHADPFQSFVAQLYEKKFQLAAT